MTDAFCGPRRPEVRSLADLRDVVGLSGRRNDLQQGFAITGHSTSLVSRTVSALNPRVIFVRAEGHDRELLAIAFTRGEHFAELVVRDRGDGVLRFYLGTFTLACDGNPDGCAPVDLFTDAVESGWSRFQVYGEQDLANTPLDCRVCHQPDGPGTPKLLRMQEFEAPWNHWFYRLSRGGRALLADYFAAHGEEAYGGVPAADIGFSQPGLLSATIASAGTPRQPNVYSSFHIEAEVIESASHRGGSQPEDNSVAGQSATWDALYDRASRGEAISVPYHDVKVTDPDKLAAATEAYAAFRAGELDRAAFPDLSDLFPDDPKRLAQMGFVTDPDLPADQLLVQACGQCHNRRLDPTVSRARFQADLVGMGPEQRQRAIARISLPPDHPAVMPPAHARQLSETARKRIMALLAH